MPSGVPAPLGSAIDWALTAFGPVASGSVTPPLAALFWSSTLVGVSEAPLSNCPDIENNDSNARFVAPVATPVAVAPLGATCPDANAGSSNALTPTTFDRPRHSLDAALPLRSRFIAPSTQIRKGPPLSKLRSRLPAPTKTLRRRANG